MFWVFFFNLAQKKLKKNLTLLFLVLYVSLFSQQNNISTSIIPVELTENSNAIVRDNSIEILLEDLNKMVVKKKVVVTVLNKLGNSDAIISQSYDNDTKITKLNAFIYDASGNQIKKYKEKDFIDVSAVDGGTLYSDSRVKYIDYNPISYPYTLVFESIYKTGTTGFIPWWNPVNGYYVSVEKSSYKISNPKQFLWRVNEDNFKNFEIEKVNNSTELSYTLKNQKAFRYERNSISYRDFLPKVTVALNKSYLKGVYGEYTNWSEFGSWMNDNLLLGKNVLNEETKDKVLSLVKGVSDPIEKAKIVYNYMQNKTRYISVQVGIGGWEPIAANEVDKVGYGDCKGLTNYTKALLDVVGVTSYYTVVYAQEKRDINKGFTSIQGNHVILNLPNEGNDIWLECTSQTSPFGFLGSFTDDRDVLVITPEGGKIKHTTSYKNDYNLQRANYNITFSDDGDLAANLSRLSYGTQYDDKSYLDGFTTKELEKEYKSEIWDYINNLDFNTIEIENNKDSVYLEEKLNLTIKNYATIKDNEFLFRVNVFNKSSYVPKRYRNRNLSLEIERGFKDIDVYNINLPESYSLDFIPENIEINSKFGFYKLTFKKIDDKSFNFYREIYIKEGLHKKEEYKNYRSFWKKITKSDNLRILITKKTINE